ncbi:MAG TPA: tRNA (adenosine(37)-N6)-dimethylallyltransferase MiaA [Thermoanaerobaculia bacterium]|nr:tRNA (adenosine(37)-N6)-dimethylallyltransferase MiaA [Thermoanaerobaculia bacterium]
MSQTLLVIAGPTGTGKSELALRLAQTIGGEVVNFDSVQVYRGFDIGSAKPSLQQRSLVPHHLFDIVDADEEFNAANYAHAANAIIGAIHARGHRAILAGGTFFYLRALLAGLPEMPGRNDEARTRIKRIATRARGPIWLHRWLSKIDPQSGRKIAPADRQRVERALEVWLTSGRPISSWERPVTDERPALKLALTLDRQRLGAMLDARVDAMFRDGLIEETRVLLERYPATARPFGTIGYREAVAVVQDAMTLADAIAEAKRRTRAYAKRQLTWLRSERNVQWLDAADREQTFRAALRLVEGTN